MKKILTLVLILIITFLLTIGLCVSCDRNEPNTTVETVGKFHHTMELKDINGTEDLYYQFRSSDNTVWWLLTETEMGFVPDYNTEYTLTYDNNGTTKENKSCDCKPEWDCECEVYDDVFINIKEV
jgi:hypothetical protein